MGLDGAARLLAARTIEAFVARADEPELDLEFDEEDDEEKEDDEEEEEDEVLLWLMIVGFTFAAS